MALALQGVPAQISTLIQDNTLERVFHDALFPRLLYRSEAMPEVWQANLGESMLFTRAGLIPVKTKPLTPGQDPTPSTYQTEQWRAEAAQHGDSVDTHMPTSYVTLASLFLRNTVSLGLNAGQTLNRLARNALYKAYLGGETVATAVGAIGATSLQVASINGFAEQQLNGRPAPVSAANPLAITFTGGAEPANTVIGAVPADPAEPFGPGTLFLGAALTAGVAAREGVLAVTRSRRLRVGGGATVDGIAGANILTLNDVINSVARLRDNNVPPTADGFYHVHVTPTGEAQLFQDNHFQRLHQSLPDSAAYRELSIGQLVGCRFYRNTENPATASVETTLATGTNALVSPEVGGELVNDNALPINRALVTGGGALYEKYLDESKYITEAGVTGRIGNFNIINGGVAVMTDRIRYIMRAPLDRLQQVIGQTWSWSGDFPVPSDGIVGDTARFKRAIVIEHA